MARFFSCRARIFLPVARFSCRMRLRSARVAAVFADLFNGFGERGDILLPQHMAKADGPAFHQRVFIQCQRPGLGQRPLCCGQRQRVGAQQARIVLPVGDLCAEPACHKQFRIAGVALDQPAGDAAFQHGGKQQAEHHSHIAGKGSEQGHTRNIKHTVNDGQHSGNERQHQNIAAVGHAAFAQHGSQRQQGAEHHPAHGPIIAGPVAVIVGPHGCMSREHKHQLMQIVGQHQQQQGSGRQVKQGRPLWQAEMIPFAQRQRHQHRQQRDKQHGQIVQIPQMPQHPGILRHHIADGANGDPQHHQCRRGGEIAAHLGLNDAPAQRNAPGCKQANVQHTAKNIAQKAQRLFHPKADLPQNHGRHNGEERAEICAVPAEWSAGSLVFLWICHGACPPRSVRMCIDVCWLWL